MKKFTHHLKHFTPLIGLLAATLVGFWIFRYDRFLQLSLTIASALGYITWGLIHHYFHKNLTLEVALEYIAIAILGVVAIFSVIIRG